MRNMEDGQNMIEDAQNPFIQIKEEEFYQSKSPFFREFLEAILFEDFPYFPYPNLNEIPVLKIKNKKYFKSGEKIKNYLNNIKEFDDSKYNRCRNCNKNNNAFYCQICKKNLCINCSENKKECKHELKN